MTDTRHRVRDPQVHHRGSVTLSTPDIARFLQETLGSRLTAHITGVKDAKMVGRWAEGTKPSPVRERRLRDTYQIFQTIMQAEDEYVARSWFIGMNPNLDDDAPADALRQGRAKQVMAAARMYAHGS